MSGTDDSGMEGRVMVGPTCPVERNPPDPACADRPLQTNLSVRTPDLKRRVKDFASDKQGWFKVSVAPGEYVIRNADQARMYPTCSAGPITVKANNYTQVRVECDSGIR
jgi:hypothetical protein